MVLFVVVFAKSPEVTSTFDMPVCPPIRMEQLGSFWMDFHEISCLRMFRKSVQNIKVNLNWTRITGTLNEDQYIYIYIFDHISLNSS
jgi:hypothetical protein